jgi:hypothetical protein
VAEGARLESVFTRKGNVGSNPTLSASKSYLQRISILAYRETRECCPFFAISQPQNGSAEKGCDGTFAPLRTFSPGPE